MEKRERVMQGIKGHDKMHIGNAKRNVCIALCNLSWGVFSCDCWKV